MNRKEQSASTESPQLRFDGRVAIVTGAGAGLGREYALLLASRGAKVVVNDLGGSQGGEGASSRAADNVVKEITQNGGIAVPDYNSVVQGERIVETAVQHFGRVDIIINNAGILRDRSILKMTENDWNLVHDVHLKGSFKVTQAAWPHMRKNNYGRIIMTASNSGIYGNFGQANYSAAKMGLVGLANTVAIEGSKYNIHCNVIVPTAASRLTEGILPDILFNELKPQLISPVVIYLCHESCPDNGSYIESAAGWAAKVETVRGKGCVLRTSIDQATITPEYVQNVWSRITDMNDAKHMQSIDQASGYLLQIVENLKEGRVSTYEDTFHYGAKDLILYALGIGASVHQPEDLKFLYENDTDFAPLPTFFVLPGLMLSMSTDLVSSALPDGKANLTNILHGEQYLEIYKEFPSMMTNGTLTTTGHVYDIMDKQSGAVVVTNCNSYDENGDLLIKNQSSIFVLGAGKFGGRQQPIDGVIPIIPCPKRKPDNIVLYKTNENQAALYRLSGDQNPLHIDPQFAAMAGHKRPILHGLCTLGYSVRAVLAKYAQNDPSRFKAVKARFAAPVQPGHSLRIEMWLGTTTTKITTNIDNNVKRIHFRTIDVDTGKEAITGAYVDLRQQQIPSSKL